MENKDVSSKQASTQTLTPPNMQAGVAAEPKVMKEFPTKDRVNKKGFKMPMWVITVLVVLAGVGTGWFLSGMTTQTDTPGTSTGITEDKKMAAGEAGMLVEDAEYEEIEGEMAEGGIDGEGTHHLVRDPNNESQNVYLTSSTLDLQAYVGKKVHVWGITISGQKAGWLMEVGKIKTLDK